MTDLINQVMKAAATELLRHEANQVDQEMELLLTEMALDPLAESRLDDFWLRFFALLKRRSGVARRALRVHEVDFRALFDLSAGLDAIPTRHQLPRP